MFAVKNKRKDTAVMKIRYAFLSKPELFKLRIPLINGACRSFQEPKRVEINTLITYREAVIFQALYIYQNEYEADYEKL